MGLSISINDQAAFDVVIGVPGPVGPVGPQGPIGPAGQGVPIGGTAGQVLAKVNGVDYNTEWITPQDQYAVWGGITGTLSSQTDLQTALDGKLPQSGGYITGDIQSLNGSQFRTFSGTDSVIVYPYQITLSNSSGSLTVDAGGISFPSSPYKQTSPFLGLAGYATEAWVTAGFYPLTGNPSGFLTSSALTGYATESWVTSELGSYLTTASAASTYQTLSGMSSYLTTSDAALTYYPLTNPSGFIGDAPSDGTIYGRQNGAWVTAGSGGSSWGSITGTLSNQTDLQGALDAKYDASNPAGFITFADLSGYATESWVNSQGFLTTAILDGYAQLSGSIFTGEISFSTSSTGRLIIDSFYESGGNTYSRFTFGTSTGTPSSVSNGDVWFDGSQLQYGQSGIQTVASQSWVNNLVGSYALKSGATFTGKVITTTTATTPSLNLGSAISTVPTNAVNGDIWITNATAPKIAFQTQGTNYYCVVANQFNTFTGGVAISGTSSSNAQLAVSQAGSATAVTISTTGTGKALVVSDESPETTATVIDNSGNLGVGVDPATWSAANKVEIVGAVKAQSITFDGTAQFKVNGTQAHATGANTHDLLISFNGSTYRVPMIFVSTP